MYGVLGEDDSDAETLDVVIRRLIQRPNLSVKRKGYGSCGQLLRRGANQLRLFRDIGCTRFVVCYDSDGNDPKERHGEVLERILKPTQIPPFVSGMSLQGMTSCCCILIPVQEIEAWILADIKAVSKVFTSWEPGPIQQNPETIPSPKEFLERLSELNHRKPIYSHATDNKEIAKHLDFGLVRQRCPSFGPLVDFVLN
ncbi:MAG: hypothetical protein JWN24_375 [Phycisphaerales bacterium]|nr:hypothetical protein [Phycisphaerales bacterium]